MTGSFHRTTMLMTEETIMAPLPPRRAAVPGLFCCCLMSRYAMFLAHLCFVLGLFNVHSSVKAFHSFQSPCHGVQTRQRRCHSVCSSNRFPLLRRQRSKPHAVSVPSPNDVTSRGNAEASDGNSLCPTSTLPGRKKSNHQRHGYFNVQNRLQEARNLAEEQQLSQEYCDQLLAECVSRREWDAVWDVVDLTKQQGLGQVKSTYTACLQACFEVSNAATSQDILQAMMDHDEENIQPDPSDIGLTVVTMCRCSSSREGKEQRKEQSKLRKSALQLAKEHEDLPIAAYDAVLSALVEERQWQEAVRLLRSMEQSRPTYSSESRQKQKKTDPALSTYRTVIECCVASNQAEQAVQVLQSCVRRGLTPTVFAFELVVSALSKKLQWRRALQLLELMDQLDVPKTLSMYNAILAATGKGREPVQAKNILRHMRKNGIQPDIISFNSVLSAYASTRRWKDALAVLDEIYREPGVSPDVYTYTNAIRACAKGGKTRRALSLLQVVKDKRLPLDTYCYTAAIEACANAGMWKKALELLGEMEKEGIAPSEVTYSVTITACGNGGEWHKALELVEIMREKSMPINLYVYNAAITAVSKAAKQLSKTGQCDGQLWKEAMSLLDHMRNDGIEPDGFSFSSAISCCGSEGRWEEALQLLDLMQNGGPKTRPNKIAYTAAISSCGRSGQVDHALRLFRQMKEQGLSADRVAYNALFSAFRVAKKSDEAIELWDEMLGVEKQGKPRIIATARASRATPDIITVTDAIGAMSSNRKEDRDRVDRVFAEAVRRGIVLQQNLDTSWEFDLSGMSFPVARAACRYILNRIFISSTKNNDSRDLIFITGVGVEKAQRKHSSQTARLTGSVGSEDDNRTVSCLREYVQEILAGDFTPSLRSHVPKRAQGTVQINADTIVKWTEERQK